MAAFLEDIAGRNKWRKRGVTMNYYTKRDFYNDMDNIPKNCFILLGLRMCGVKGFREEATI